MADFSIASSIRSLSFIGAARSAYQRSLKGGAGLLGCLRDDDRPTEVHPLINKVVNRTPPITKAIQVKSMALKVTQSFQPSRKEPIRPPALFRDTTASLSAR